MTRRELSDDGATWNIPGSRTKNGRAHTVPLSPLVRELIASVKAKPDSPFIFDETGTTARVWLGPYEGSPRRGDARRRARGGPRGHSAVDAGGRSSPAFELHVPPHVVELVVNHISGTRAGGAGTYNRSESRTQGGARPLGDARARPRGAMAGQRVARKRRWI
jgi:hypothetical protein